MNDQHTQTYTHWPACWKAGPSHHACALAEIERLQQARHRAECNLVAADAAVERLRAALERIDRLDPRYDANEVHHIARAALDGLGDSAAVSPNLSPQPCLLSPQPCLACRASDDTPLERCAQYPRCPCGGPEGWGDGVPANDARILRDELEAAAEEFLRLQWAFPTGDSRREDLRRLHNRFAGWANRDAAQQTVRQCSHGAWVGASCPPGSACDNECARAAVTTAEGMKP